MEIVPMIFRNIAMFPTFFQSPMAVDPPLAIKCYQPGPVKQRRLEELSKPCEGFMQLGHPGTLDFTIPVKRHETMRRLHVRHGKSIGHGGYFMGENSCYETIHISYIW